MNAILQPNDEYRVLRDEMLNLFTRVLIVFAATVAAFVTLTLKGLDQGDQLKGGLILLLAIVIVVAAILLSLEFYQNLYSIGSYICVYFEEPSAGWHIRSRHMRIVLRERPIGKKLIWLEKVNEPGTLSFAYLIMVTSLPLLFFLHFGIPRCGTNWIVASLLFVFWIGAIVLLCFLRKVYREGSENWVARWSAYKADYPQSKLKDICSNVKAS
jgi:hypothetical protein